MVAFDLSAGMLRQAAGRGCYTATVQGCCPDMAGTYTAAGSLGLLLL